MNMLLKVHSVIFGQHIQSHNCILTIVISNNTNLELFIFPITELQAVLRGK